jgi:hypothetical protein
MQEAGRHTQTRFGEVAPESGAFSSSVENQSAKFSFRIEVQNVGILCLSEAGVCRSSLCTGYTSYGTDLCVYAHRVKNVSILEYG